MAQVITQQQMPPAYRQVRWWILALLFSVTVINFVDRLTLAYVAPVLKQTFNLSNTDYGFIISWFLLGMMIGEFPMGWLMDRKGPKVGFSFAVLWWSIATALHAVGQTRWQFSLFRFWMGTGECANYSGGVKVIGQWFPARERALATGVMNGASLVGNMITPPLIVYLLTRFNWHTAFLIPAALGFVWVFFGASFIMRPKTTRE
ncbi:MAG: MFS transporter [Pyrinomonadaceae bacterium]